MYVQILSRLVYGEIKIWWSNITACRLQSKQDENIRLVCKCTYACVLRMSLHSMARDDGSSDVHVEETELMD